MESFLCPPFRGARPIFMSSVLIILTSFCCYSSIDIGGEEKILCCREGCLLSLVGKTPKDRTLDLEFINFPTLAENTKAASDWGDALSLCLAFSKEIQKVRSSPNLRLTPLVPLLPLLHQAQPDVPQSVFSSPTLSPVSGKKQLSQPSTPTFSSYNRD